MEIASILIRSGANVNVKKPNDTFESSLLYELGSSKNLKHHEVALLTMEYGGEATVFEMEYIFCRAIDTGSLSIVEALLKKGTEVRNSVIHQMVRSPHIVQLVGLIIDQDTIPVETKYVRAVNTFYQLYLLPGDEHQILPAIDAMCSRLDVDVINTYGDVLICAIRCRKSKTVQVLIEYGINVNKSSRDGVLPLYLSASTNQPEVVKLLIFAGAKINAHCGSESRSQISHYGQCALHAACRGVPKLKVLNILLYHEADVKVLDLLHRTPFSYAKFLKSLTDIHRMMIKRFAILESKGVDIHPSDKKIIEENPLMKKFCDECMSELTSMKSINISECTTLFSILIQNVEKLSFFMRSRRFRDKCGENQLEKLFPHYVEDVKLKLKNAEKRKNAMAVREGQLREIFNYVLPYPVLENILFHCYQNTVNFK
ncbi:protein TANC1-like isoform X2 [Phymastichus coffea]|nr:protein TANC1-like isoform X2 [Phymastichus coffea]